MADVMNRAERRQSKATRKPRRQCLVCGSVFVPTGNQLYCSDVCKQRGKSIKPDPAACRTLQCPVCESFFRQRHTLQRYCSRKCAQTAQSQRTQTCKNAKRQHTLDIWHEQTPLDTTVRKAASAGLTYGEYVLRCRIESAKNESERR